MIIFAARGIRSLRHRTIFLVLGPPQPAQVIIISIIITSFGFFVHDVFNVGVFSSQSRAMDKMHSEQEFKTVD
jgi:hypothetical protein